MYTILDTETASLQSGVVELALLHIDAELWRDGQFEPSDFRAVGRMGGKEYVDLAEPEIFEMMRPKLG